MNIISVDLPWQEKTKGRSALAIADLRGRVEITRAGDDELLELVRKNAELESIILLDIPIEGCNCLEGKHFRPIDKAFAHQTLPPLPASRAGNRGKSLKERLEKDKNRLKVCEIYPYAIYKFLAYLKDRNLLHHLNSGRFDALLCDRFRAYWPPKYKRERKRDKRLGNMGYLYLLLTDSNIGLHFSPPLRHPDTSSNLAQLSDEYNACLGAIVGLYFANKSSYAQLVGDSNSGNILLFTDQWLAELLNKEVNSPK